MGELELEIGSVVHLNSGGPEMTLVYLGSESARVVWFDDDAHIQEAELPLAAIHLADYCDVGEVADDTPEVPKSVAN